jgi:hypothetical protein
MAAGRRNIEARRKLSDLYARGAAMRFGPDPAQSGEDFPEVIYKIAPKGNKGQFPDDEPCPEDWIEIWVQPPSPDQRDMALRDAQAARARAILNTKRDEKSEEHLTSKAFLAEMSLPTLVDYVLMTKVEERHSEAIRDVLADDQWKDFSELQDAMRQFDEALADNPDAADDPEWAGLLARDEEYGAQVIARENELIEAGRESYAMLPREELERRALDQRGELVGSQRFMNEYELQMMFYAIRDPESHGELFFETARELAKEDEDFRAAAGAALSPFISDGGQAKNLLRAVSGSESSAPPATPETSESSTPETPSE